MNDKKTTRTADLNRIRHLAGLPLLTETRSFAFINNNSDPNFASAREMSDKDITQIFLELVMRFNGTPTGIDDSEVDYRGNPITVITQGENPVGWYDKKDKVGFIKGMPKGQRMQDIDRARDEFSRRVKAHKDANGGGGGGGGGQRT